MSPIITTCCGGFNSTNPPVMDPPGMIPHCLSLFMILIAASIISTKSAEFTVIEDRYRLSKYNTRI
jgi:hypothetical protein